MLQTFYLLVAAPDKEPVSYPLSGEKITLGRSPDNDIQILVREVSVNHCELHRTDSGYELVDVGSTNGTKVNTKPSKDEKVRLSNRDIVLLGETIPTYFVEAEEGTAIDVKALIRDIQADANAAGEKLKPAVKKLVPPSAVKKVGLPTKKPPVSTPLKPTPAEGSQSGSATVKLVPPVAKKLSPPSLAKQVTPGAPPVSPVKPPQKPASPDAPPTKLVIPDTPPAAKLATPGSEGEPAKKLAVPNQDAEGSPPKLDLPEKKDAPKLNLPPKTDD